MFNALQTQPAEVSDFSGGITDNYLDCRPNQYQDGDNLLITDNRKLITRPGSEISDLTNYLPAYVTTNERTGLLFTFETTLFENQGRNLYYIGSGTYQTLVGPSSNPALPAGTTASRSSWAYWNHHLLLTNDAFGAPQKIYKDGSGNFKVRTAGLPDLATLPVLTGAFPSVLVFANDLKAKFNAHLGDAAQHTTAVDAAHTTTSANATNLATLITLITEMIADYTAHEADSQLTTAWLYHRAKATVLRPLASLVAPTTLTECVTRLSDISSHFNAHDNDVVTHAVAGSHQQTLSTADLRNYIYAFHYSYIYTVGSASFKDSGPTKLVQIEGIDMPNASTVAITAIPVIANGVTGNYETTAIKVEIYRTIDGGQTLYKVGEVTNGTTTFNDSVSDDTLQEGLTIYTDGDVLDNDPPPLAKFLVVANDITWYLHVKEGTEVKTNRIRQSNAYDPDGCPASFFVDVEDEITGGANIGIYPVVFCTNRIYRLEGFFDLLGQGGIIKQEISRTVGCVSHLGVVVTLDGIFFPGIDGFYWTNGYQVTKISQELNVTYSALVVTATQKKNIYGAYDQINKRVYWAVQEDTSSGDNDAFFIADLKFGIKADTPFTTASGRGDSFAPSAIIFHNNELYRADKRGYLFLHRSDAKTDPKVDVLAAPTDWHVNTIIYDYKSAASNFGSIQVRKWVPSIVINCKNNSNMSLGIRSYNDDSILVHELKEVRLLSNILWGDSKITWGDATITWNYTTLIKAFRRFPARGLRCSYKQIQLTNSYTIVESSDSLGTATVDPVTATATLDLVGHIWPTEAVDYFISFQADDYVKEYLVTDVADEVLTYLDIASDSPAGAGVKWLLRGYRKTDVLDLLNYSVNFALLSATQDPFRVIDEGMNQ